MITVHKNSLLLRFEAKHKYREEKRYIEDRESEDGHTPPSRGQNWYIERVPDGTEVSVSVARADSEITDRYKAAIDAVNAILRESRVGWDGLPDYDAAAAKIPVTFEPDCTFELEGHPDLSDLDSQRTILVRKGIRGWYPEKCIPSCPYFGLDGELRSDVDAFPDPSDLERLEQAFQLALMWLEEKGYLIDERYSSF